MTTPPRRLRVALHAFPRRFRAVRSDEIVATFREAELAGERHPYGLRALADVVVAGWAERLRTHPPLAHYLRYRLLDGRLDPRWHRWMLDDVRGWFGLRRGAWASLMLIALAAVLHRAGRAHLDPSFVVVYVPAFVLVAAIVTPIHRRRILRRHGYDPETLTWAPPNTWAPRPPRPIAVAPLAFTLAAALAVVAPFAVLASLGLIGAGSDNLTRHADGQTPLTIAALGAAALVTAGGIIARRSISERFTRAVEDPARVDLVFSDLPSAGALSGAVMAVGLVTCVLPVAPLIAPLAFIVLAGAVPTLVIVGTNARRRGDAGLIVWTARPVGAVEAPTT